MRLCQPSQCFEPVRGIDESADHAGRRHYCIWSFGNRCKLCADEERQRRETQVAILVSSRELTSPVVQGGEPRIVASRFASWEANVFPTPPTALPPLLPQQRHLTTVVISTRPSKKKTHSATETVATSLVACGCRKWNSWIRGARHYPMVRITHTSFTGSPTRPDLQDFNNPTRRSPCGMSINLLSFPLLLSMNEYMIPHSLPHTTLFLRSSPGYTTPCRRY